MTVPYATDEGIVDLLRRFVYYLANEASRGHTTPLMSPDEIIGELMYEIAKGIKVYRDKPLDELLLLLKRMCDNRVSELRYRYYVTHRKAATASYTISVCFLDRDTCDDHEFVGGYQDYSFGEILASRWRVDETRRRLSQSAKQVFDAVVYGNTNIGDQIYLSGMRSSQVFKNGGSVRLKLRHVAEGLCMDLVDVRQCFGEIRRVYGEVCSEY